MNVVAVLVDGAGTVRIVNGRQSIAMHETGFVVDRRGFVVVDDPKVSRVHAEIVANEEVANLVSE